MWIELTLQLSDFCSRKLHLHLHIMKSNIWEILCPKYLWTSHGILAETHKNNLGINHLQWKQQQYCIKQHHVPYCLRSSEYKRTATTYPAVCESSLLHFDNDYVSLLSSTCLQVLAATEYYYYYSQDVIRVTKIKR